MDLSSRLRAIVRGSGAAYSGPLTISPDPGTHDSTRPPEQPRRELTYEPDTGQCHSILDIARVAEVLGGRAVKTAFGDCLAIDRRYESDRWHGDVRIGECEFFDSGGLHVLDPSLRARWGDVSRLPSAERNAVTNPLPVTTGESRRLFIDLETTGLSGGAGTVAFLVGCGYFDLGAFQVRQFLLTSYAGERALLAAVADFFDAPELIVTYNGKTFDVPVMETRWVFHRMEMPLDGVPHFDMLHPARRLWRSRMAVDDRVEEGGCRLTALERTLLAVQRSNDVAAFEIPRRFFHFLRTGNPCPLEPVLEHNRMDLVSLAAITARAVRLAQNGAKACRDCTEALALGRLFERAGLLDRAEACYRRAAASGSFEVRGEALYRLGLRCRRDRRFEEAAAIWRQILDLTKTPIIRRSTVLDGLRHFAAEALAIHHEHRVRDYAMARDLATYALAETPGGRRGDGMRHRVARLDRKMARKEARLLFS